MPPHAGPAAPHKLPSHLYPLVIVLEAATDGEVGTTVPVAVTATRSALQAADDAARVDVGLGARPWGGAGSAAAAAAAAGGHLQATYVAFERHAVAAAAGGGSAQSASTGSTPAGFVVSREWSPKTLKQKIQVDGRVYSVLEIYGIDATTRQQPDAAAAAAAPAASNGSSDGSSSDDEKQRGGVPRKRTGAEPKAGRASDAPAATTSGECVVCLSEPRDTTVFPCRHMCLCNDCANQLRYSTTATKCPVCRARKCYR